VPNINGDWLTLASLGLLNEVVVEPQAPIALILEETTQLAMVVAGDILQLTMPSDHGVMNLVIQPSR
jgi:hypothetical protein